LLQLLHRRIFVPGVSSAPWNSGLLQANGVTGRFFRQPCY
jgi:hypothetical protein